MVGSDRRSRWMKVRPRVNGYRSQFRIGYRRPGRLAMVNVAAVEVVGLGSCPLLANRVCTAANIGIRTALCEFRG